jgi:hypothetical protein
MKPLGDEVAAIEGELWIGVKEKRGGEADEPGRGGQADGNAEDAAELTHEVTIRYRIWRAGDINALHRRIGESPLEEPVQVDLVNLAHPLLARANRSAEAEAG